jgi:5-(carboxyamino)imidazole ribonucleotide synthase
MRIGILGAGQLGRMLALAGLPLGLEFLFVDPSPEACARTLGEFLCADYSDPAALTRFCARAQLATFEFENVPLSVAERIAGRLPLHPGVAALRVAQDRLREKALFERLGIAVAPHAPVDSVEQLAAALEHIGSPAILKSRRLGYDGKGQFSISSAADVPAAWKALGGQPLLLERRLHFTRELSCIAVRARDGEMRFYPLTENVHRAGILRLSRPRAGDPLQASAEAITARLLKELDYVGVLACEFFVVDGQLVANEIAPRVHNSGHWTLDGADCSQFENHLRAITGLPLGDTTTIRSCAMVNLIGDAPPRSELLSLPGAHLHLYDKRPKPLRKIGHLNLVARDEATLDRTLDRALEICREQPTSI